MATESTRFSNRVFRFGPFELSEREGELRKNGIRIKLQEQPCRVLLELLISAGEVISREDLQQKLWPSDTFVDFDTGLNTAIRKLRQSLNDDADEPRYIETLARRGYRFIAPVSIGLPAERPLSVPAVRQLSAIGPEQVLDTNPSLEAKPDVEPGSASIAVQEPSEAAVRSSEEESNRKWKWIAVGAIAVALIVAIVFWWTRPSVAPVVGVITQLTDDEKGKIYLQTDGARVYFNEDRQGSLDIAQVSVKGGRVATIPTNVLSPAVAGIAPDASSLLVLQGGFPVPRPVWEVPLPAGDPRQMSNLEAHEASITPDGRLLLCRVTDLLIAEKDGSNPRTILRLTEGHFGGAEMSPDGRRIVFTHYGNPELYVVNSDGTEMRLLAKADGRGGFCCARWTPDGQYIVFSNRFPSPRQDLWYLRMNKGWLEPASQPKRLTAGPLSYWMPAPSRDGETIFAIGTKQRSELFRYDLTKRELVPFSSGVAELTPTFSGDGKWLAYTSADGSLWRRRSDGSERLQLTFPPVATWNPIISPDGKWVAYGKADGGYYVISMDGGVPRKIFDHPIGAASWSPDGRYLVFNEGGTSWQTPEIMLLDVGNGQASHVDGGQLYPQWVAPGKFVGARRDMMVLQIYDLSTRQWSDLTKPEDGPVVNWAHSPNFKYFYYTTRGQDPRLFRIHMADLRSEIVTGLKDVQVAPGSLGYTQIGVTPDDSPIFTYVIGTQEIYALSVKWP